MAKDKKKEVKKDGEKKRAMKKETKVAAKADPGAVF